MLPAANRYFVPFAKLNAFKDALKEVIGRVEMRRAQGVTPPGAIPWDKQCMPSVMWDVPVWQDGESCGCLYIFRCHPLPFI